MSETAKLRHHVLPYLPPMNLIDVGYGGDPVAPWAIAVDLPGGSYHAIGNQPQQIGADAMDLPFRSETLDGVYSSHLIEDFTYADQARVLREWDRVLRVGGVLAIIAPDQKRFEATCARTGQSLNPFHKEPDMSLATFMSVSMASLWGVYKVEQAFDVDGDYSFIVVARKFA